MPLRWKVCGVTRLADALAAVQAGADAIGFHFSGDGARKVSVQEAARMSAALPASTWRFGVFVDAPPAVMASITEAVGLDFLQLADGEFPGACHGLPRHAFKVLRPQARTDAAALAARADQYPECTLIVEVDAGGGGDSPWDAVAALARRHRLMLGGDCLDADTLPRVVERVRPWAVDVSRGVESAPGIKDHHKLQAFGRALRPFC